MSNFRPGSEWVELAGLSPELAELDDEVWLHPWRERVKQLGQWAYEGLQLSGRAFYPMCWLSPLGQARPPQERRPGSQDY